MIRLCGVRDAEEPTLCTEVGPSNVFGDTLEPARLDTIEASLALYELFSAHVNWTIVVT
jgi:hypothetical protein